MTNIVEVREVLLSALIEGLESGLRLIATALVIALLLLKCLLVPVWNLVSVWNYCFV